MYAGFGNAPKFPRPPELLFLHRQYARTGNAKALEMSVRTLDAMASGGIHDQLAGGFHRYSTDAFWREPHFEKMLYDQAQLVVAYLEPSLLALDTPEISVSELESFVMASPCPNQNCPPLPRQAARDTGPRLEGL